MASSGAPTPSVGLNQWQSSDKPERVDFNQDNNRIDTAIKNLQDEVEGMDTAIKDLGAVAIRPIEFTLPAAAWGTSVASEHFGYEAMLSIPGFAASDRADVAFDLDSGVYASNAGVSAVTVSAAGGVMLYAEDSPENPLTGSYVVFKGV